MDRSKFQILGSIKINTLLNLKKKIELNNESLNSEKMRSLMSKESENDLFKNNLKFNYQETNSDGFLDENNSSNNNDEDGYDLFRGDESGSENTSSSSSLNTNRMSLFNSHLIKPIFLIINIFLVKILQ